MTLVVMPDELPDANLLMEQSLPKCDIIMTNQQIKDLLKEQLKKANKIVEKQIHSYSGSEAWRDVKKTAVITSTAMLTILSCFVSGE
tara:strand:+ start:17423 stop:17683 length:261 start_codon:yes stop_codon:yes gene_type:complete